MADHVLTQFVAAYLDLYSEIPERKKSHVSYVSTMKRQYEAKSPCDERALHKHLEIRNVLNRLTGEINHFLG